MSKIALVAKCCKMRKYSLAKFATFVYFCIACGNCYHTWAENGSNFRTQYKSIQNLQTLQGYIFCILQHFATKLCTFTHFSMLFLSSCSDLFASPCLVVKLVYNGNCLLVCYVFSGDINRLLHQDHFSVHKRRKNVYW
jgi:hypothetical protein